MLDFHQVYWLKQYYVHKENIIEKETSFPMDMSLPGTSVLVDDETTRGICWFNGPFKSNTFILTKGKNSM